MRDSVHRRALATLAGLAAVLLGFLALPGPGRADEPALTPWAHLPVVFQAPTATPGPTPIPPDDLAKEEAVLARINAERAQQGLPALFLVASLTQSARRHSRDMADNNFTDHTGSDGSNAGQRMREAGYEWSAWGEIIAWGFGGDPDWVVDWWMNSPPHRDLILSATYLDFGAGYAYNAQSTYKHYWTVNFGRPAGGGQGQGGSGQFCTLAVEGLQGGVSLAAYGPSPCP